MVRKDLLRRARSPLGVLVLLAFPIIFSLMIAITFGTGGDATPRIHLLVENHDDNFVGGALSSMLSSEQSAEFLDVELVGEDGAALMEKGKASALLRIPEGTTEAILEGNQVSLELIRNPAQGIMPEVAEQMADVLVEILDSAARVLREPLDQIAAMDEEGGIEINEETVTALALSAYHTVDGVQSLLFPPVITFDSVTLQSEENVSGRAFSSIFVMFLSGVSVYSLFLLGDLAMRDLLTEVAGGTLRRQLAGPVRAGTLLLAKTLYTAVLCTLSLVLLSALGWAMAGRNIDLPGFALLSFALVLAVTGASATLYGASGNETRGSAVGAVVYLVLAFAGGSFVNLESLPAAVRSVSPISPFYWGTSGYRTLLESGGGLTDILPNAGVLAGLGLGLLMAGASLLNRRMLKGRA